MEIDRHYHWHLFSNLTVYRTVKNDELPLSYCHIIMVIIIIK